jgi:TRAP-type uncharacterized transport system fused permease subunit
MFKKAKGYERAILVVAGLSLVYPSFTYDMIGLALVGVAVFSQKVLRSKD